MKYPALPDMYRILKGIYKKLGSRSIAEKFIKNNSERKTLDHTTVSRVLKDPAIWDDHEQTKLVNALRDVLKENHKLDLPEEYFRLNDVLAFCARLNIPKTEAARLLRKHIPVPDIMIDSVFQFASEANSVLVGCYLVYRYDRDRQQPSKTPYIQACAQIIEDEHGSLIYKDEWSIDNFRESYEGPIYRVGSFINIVGESKSRGIAARPELWWCGLEGWASARGKGTQLYGYVSDISSNKRLFTDRIVLIRVERREWCRVRNDKEFYVGRKRVKDLAGEQLLAYLFAWRSVPL